MTSSQKVVATRRTSGHTPSDCEQQTCATLCANFLGKSSIICCDHHLWSIDGQKLGGRSIYFAVPLFHFNWWTLFATFDFTMDMRGGWWRVKMRGRHSWLEFLFYLHNRFLIFDLINRFIFFLLLTFVPFFSSTLLQNADHNSFTRRQSSPAYFDQCDQR